MPTKTINRLHIEDLSPQRFEDLCMMLLYRLDKWESIEHLGRVGSDNGIDIRANKRRTDDSLETWFIQCKRVKTMSLKETKNIIDKIITKNKTIPDILLLITGCDVSKKTFDGFKQYATTKGVKSALLWSGSLLEAKLYSEHKDLLYTYFGVNTIADTKSKISSIKRNIALKSRMRKDFIRSKYTYDEVKYNPYKKFEHSEAIIHSIYDDIYPDIDEKGVGISPWFKVELYNFYHNGLEVILRAHNGIINNMGGWDIVKHDSSFDKKIYTPITILETGCIPFENIVEYDLSGDEYYNFPHIYCEFKNAGMPYEDFICRISKEGQYPYVLEKNKRLSRGK